MILRSGYEISYAFPSPSPAVMTLNVHYSRVSDLIRPDHMITDPAVPMTGYRDGFGNWCTRLVAPAGQLTVRTEFDIRDSGRTDPVAFEAVEHPVQDLPEEALVFLLPSRFCESDRFLDLAWGLFGQVPPGWARVQAISDHVHRHLTFGYEHARDTRGAFEAYQEKVGVCRDFTHVAIAFCRALNIPTRYCTGYLGDVGMQPPYPPGDFAAWMEVYLGGGWHVFDPRNNQRRIGRILVARGRDAADVALATTYGRHVLTGFRVWSDLVA